MWQTLTSFSFIKHQKSRVIKAPWHQSSHQTPLEKASVPTPICNVILKHNLEKNTTVDARASAISVSNRKKVGNKYIPPLLFYATCGCLWADCTLNLHPVSFIAQSATTFSGSVKYFKPMWYIMGLPVLEPLHYSALYRKWCGRYLTINGNSY